MTQIRFEDQELILAEKLKSLCYQNGKEKNPKQSAEVFHKLGLVYKERSPDKICLIQSAALLNAAIVRNPDDVEIVKTDLHKLCQHILNVAKAKNQKSDLVKYANEVKDEIKELRLDVEALLQRVEIIPEEISNQRDLLKHEQLKVISMQMIQNHISSDYTKIMSGICRFCETTMGKPPCEYSVVGMGSLARKEATPYSDFEHLIVLEEGCQNKHNYNEIKNYFRWLSVIFHVIVINLQETIIPSVCISSLENSKTHQSWFKDFVTPRGISFDGMMPHASKFPLGRTQPTSVKPFTTELIQPVSEMLKYLSSKENLKNGYHLSDILTKTCFVSGSEKVCEMFQSGVTVSLENEDQTEVLDLIKKEVKEDLGNYGTKVSFYQLQPKQKFNFKRVIYRSTTLFVSALGKLHKIGTNSSFDIIEQLLKKELISRNTRNKLMYAIALACEVRLKMYQLHQRQEDWVGDSLTSPSINKITEAVGERSVISYFQIASCLQAKLLIHLQMKNLSFYPNLVLTNINVLHFMGKDKELITLIQRVMKNPRSLTNSAANFDLQLSYLEVQTSDLKYFSIAPDNPFTLEKDNTNKLQIGSYLSQIGAMLHDLEKYNESQQLFEKSIKELSNSEYPMAYDNAILVAKAMSYLGSISTNTNQHEDGLKHHQKALAIYNKITNDENSDADVAISLYHIGDCLMNMKQYPDALEQHQKALAIYKKITPDENADEDVAISLIRIGNCLMNMKQYPDALEQYQKALAIYNKRTTDKNTDKNIAISLNRIGNCLQNMKQYAHALEQYRKAFAIYNKRTTDENSDKDVAISLIRIGNCLMNMKQYPDALEQYRKALAIYNKRTPDENADEDVAISLIRIGNCLMNMKQYPDALEQHQKALAIYNKRTTDKNTDKNIAISLNRIGNCLQNMKQYAHALEQYRKALAIYNKRTTDENSDEDVEISLYQIGDCLMDMKQYPDALEQHQKALAIYKKITPDENADEDVASSLIRI